MHIRPIVSALFLIMATVGNAQQKINCESCQSSILIVVDQQCRLRVDAQPLGVVAAGESKLVRVDPGEHLIEAQAEDLKWDQTVQIEKPGQVIVRTKRSTLKTSAKWAGEWVGGKDYGDFYSRTGNIAHYQHYFGWYPESVIEAGGGR